MENFFTFSTFKPFFPKLNVEGGRLKWILINVEVGINVGGGIPEWILINVEAGINEEVGKYL